MTSHDLTQPHTTAYTFLHLPDPSWDICTYLHIHYIPKHSLRLGGPAVDLLSSGAFSYGRALVFDG